MRQARSRPSRSFAWALWGASSGLSLVALALLVATLDVPIRDVYGYRGAAVLIAVPFSSMGVLLAVRRSRNPIGWLFLAAGLAIAFGVFGEQYTTYSVARSAGRLPLTEPIAWLQSSMWVFLIAFGLIYPFVLFPDGHPPTPRWRWLLRVAPALVLAFAILLSLEPGTLQSTPLENPYAIEEDLSQILVAVAAVPFLATAALSVVAMALQFRRSTGDEHEQLKWLLSAGAITALALVMNMGTAGRTSSVVGQVVAVGTLAAIGTIPVAAGIAVLKYRLYDIDVVISRTLAYSIVAGFITLAYVGVIVGVGAVVGRFGGSNVILPVAATAIVAAGFHPVRQRARAFADRVIYGKRRTGYEALAGLASSRTLEELGSNVARLATESTGITRCIVWISSGVVLEPAAAWPEGAPMPAPMPLSEGAIVTLPEGVHTFSLIHQGDLLGAISMETARGESLSSDDNRLLSDLATHAAIALRGLLEAVVLPEGIVTFLMTDVVGSTRLWEDDPKATAGAMREHDALVRRVVQEHAGILMKWRGEGDSTFSVFPAAANAVTAAHHLRVAVAQHLWPTPRPLRIRAALHTGEAELRGRDYFGQAVNRCARLRSIATGGEVLVSAATRELARDRLPEHLELVDTGERQLKDVGTERVYGLRPVGLRR